MLKKRRDPYGSRGSKLYLLFTLLDVLLVEILMDLVDLNFFHIKIIVHFIRRDPYGSRGSKSNKFFALKASPLVEILMDLVDLNIIRDKGGNSIKSRSLWISWI